MKCADCALKQSGAFVCSHTRTHTHNIYYCTGTHTHTKNVGKTFKDFGAHTLASYLHPRKWVIVHIKRYHKDRMHTTQTSERERKRESVRQSHRFTVNVCMLKLTMKQKLSSPFKKQMNAKAICEKKSPSLRAFADKWHWFVRFSILFCNCYCCIFESILLFNEAKHANCGLPSFAFSRLAISCETSIEKQILQRLKSIQ